MPTVNELLAQLRNFLDSFKPIPQTNPFLLPKVTEGFLTGRGVTLSNVYAQANAQVQAMFADDWVWVNDLVLENDEKIFAIVGYEGRLYRSPVEVMDGIATLGELEQVEVQYTPVEVRSVGGGSITITRDAKTGKRKWLRQISTAVLLRSGSTLEIDSRDLYESFIAHIARTKQLPIASLYHMGHNFRVGQVTAVWADGYCLCDAGEFDDTDLATRLADSVEANPAYWGTSIEFSPLSLPDREEIAGATIYVHREGILTSGDFLPEAHAASLFTGGITLKRGIMTAQQRQTLRLLGYTDEEIDARAEMVRATNERVAADGLIARTQTPPATPAPETPAGDPAPEQPTIELTAEALEQLRSAVLVDVPTRAELTAIQTGITAIRDTLAQIVLQNTSVQEQVRNAPAPIRVVVPNQLAATEQPAPVLRKNGRPASVPATQQYEPSAMSLALAKSNGQR